MCIHPRANSDLPCGCWRAVWKSSLEATTKYVPVERSRRIQQHREIFMKAARDLTAIVLEHEVRNAIERLAQQTARLPRCDQVVDRRRAGFSRHLPSETTDIRVDERCPKSQPARSRPSIHHRALVRMPELVDVERILVMHPPLFAQVIPGRRQR
jgi:hypothetical protein